MRSIVSDGSRRQGVERERSGWTLFVHKLIETVRKTAACSL
jgi:hypothetical protein